MPRISLDALKSPRAAATTSSGVAYASRGLTLGVKPIFTRAGSRCGRRADLLRFASCAIRDTQEGGAARISLVPQRRLYMAQPTDVRLAESPIDLVQIPFFVQPASLGRLLQSLAGRGPKILDERVCAGEWKERSSDGIPPQSGPRQAGHALVHPLEHQARQGAIGIVYVLEGLHDHLFIWRKRLVRVAICGLCRKRWVNVRPI